MVNIEDGDLREAMVSAGAGQIVGWGPSSDAYQCIRAALAAAEALGYVLAPVRSTDAMCKAADDAVAGYPDTSGYLLYDDRRSVWDAMIAARPAVLSRASGSELSGDQLEQRVTESAAKPEE